MADALDRGNRDKLGEILFSSALRSVPLCAKPLIEIGERYPDELASAEFSRAYGIASGHGKYVEYVGEDRRVIIDPIFNPARTLFAYDQANMPTGRNETISGAANDSKEELTPDQVKHRTAIDIMFALERARSLRDALDVYRRSRSGRQG